MTQPRDTQRKRVYDAEWAAFVGPYDHQDVERLRGQALSLQECQALVDKWCSSAVVRRHWPRARRSPVVIDGRGRRRAGYYCHRGGEITMPVWTRQRWLLLHELAHHLVRERPAHGWQFVQCYLQLVRWFMGRGAEEVLKAQFKAHRVKYRPPRRRQMTEAQREAARQRMLAMHAARKEATAA